MRKGFQALFLILLVAAQIESAFCCSHLMSSKYPIPTEEVEAVSKGQTIPDVSSADLSQNHFCQHNHSSMMVFDSFSTRFNFSQNSLNRGLLVFLPETRTSLPWQPPRFI